MQTPIAVSTWSLHHLLGTSFANGPGLASPFKEEPTWGRGHATVMQLPFELARRGYGRCEICHFHIGSLELEYLAKLKQAFVHAGVVVQTLLIDDGDLTNPATLERDKAWIAKWIEAAGILGAENVRVIAGKSKPTPEALALSVAGLNELVALGAIVGVKVATENWHHLLSTPYAVHHVLDRVEGLGFMADTGNWSGPTKYQDLASIFARPNLCHAKAHFEPGLKMDEVDFEKCLAAAHQAKYTGPMTLIFMDDLDEWRGLDLERHFIARFADAENA